MFVYKTKYFGEFSANADDKQIIIEAKKNTTGTEQEISIILDIEKMTDVNDCIIILDDYMEIYEKSKAALEAENRKKGSPANKMEAPDIRVEIKKGIVSIFLVYGTGKEIEEMIEVKMNKKYEIQGIEYYE